MTKTDAVGGTLGLLADPLRWRILQLLAREQLCTCHLQEELGAKALGTGLLVALVVGSGVATQRLSPGRRGLQLLEKALVTALGLTLLIAWLGPVSGAHFNPVVSMASWA